VQAAAESLIPAFLKCTKGKRQMPVTCKKTKKYCKAKKVPLPKKKKKVETLKNTKSKKCISENN
jgi:carbonic anhydrase